MSNITEIHSGKTPVRYHFIPEWAAKRNLSQSDVAREIGADKSLVSRWWNGMLPKPDYLERLAALFGTDVHGLFRDPEEDWLARFFRDKSEAQREQAIEMLKVLFKDLGKTGTDH